jgi:hypothetical protein
MNSIRYMTFFVVVAFLLVSPPAQVETLAQAPNPQPPGTVIAHSFARTGAYLGSPSLAVLPDGTYIASHDFFGPGTKYDTMRVYRSKDKGAHWNQIAEIKGQWWSTLFLHRGALYLIGTTKENGACVIRRSTDGGATWTTPKDANTGLLLPDEHYHCAPVPVIVHNGRLWRAMEDTSGGTQWGKRFMSFMMSAPVDADLLKTESWTFSNRLTRNAEWLGGQFGGWLEGNAVVAPDGSMKIVLRVDYKAGPEEKAAIVNVSADGSTAEFDPTTGFVDMPGACKKFTIRFDPKTKRYWTLANEVPAELRSDQPSRTRNTLSLMSSADLRTWKVHKRLLQHPDTKTHGFQYVDWLFEGNDMIAVIRTAFDDAEGGAHNQHDSNYITFHRFKGFRKL